MIKSLLVATTTLLFITISFAQNKQAITHESMWLMKRVGSPQVSPDGKWVVFNVTDASYTESEQVSDLWIASTDGIVKPRRLTTGKGGEGGYQWSPDGKYLAFSSNHAGQSDIYVISADGQAWTNLTDKSDGDAVSPIWKP